MDHKGRMLVFEELLAGDIGLRRMVRSSNRRCTAKYANMLFAAVAIPPGRRNFLEGIRSTCCAGWAFRRSRRRPNAIDPAWRRSKPVLPAARRGRRSLIDRVVALARARARQGHRFGKQKPGSQAAAGKTP
jgi:hypothetical protein